MELIKFDTPEKGFSLNGVQVDVIWDDEFSSFTKDGVYIIVDENASRVIDILRDPQGDVGDEWDAWDENIFYYCESEAEWNDILANGHDDGWKVI